MLTFLPAVCLEEQTSSLPPIPNTQIHEDSAMKGQLCEKKAGAIKSIPEKLDSGMDEILL